MLAPLPFHCLLSCCFSSHVYGWRWVWLLPLSLGCFSLTSAGAASQAPRQTWCCLVPSGPLAGNWPSWRY